jgi:hypothetical protein
MSDKAKELLQKTENTHTLLARIESAQRRRKIKLWWKNLWTKCKSIFKRT